MSKIAILVTEALLCHNKKNQQENVTSSEGLNLRPQLAIFFWNTANSLNTICPQAQSFGQNVDVATCG